MKNQRIEKTRAGMRTHNRNTPWNLIAGLYIPHTYAHSPNASEWDDVGLIINRRKVMVWWVHPRKKYLDAIEEQAMRDAGPMPDEDIFGEPIEKHWKKVGRSRKTLIACGMSKSSDRLSTYFKRVNAIEGQLRAEGINHTVRASISARWYRWGVGINLCLPVEVRNIEELRHLAELAERLLRRECTISEIFPDYIYRQEDWIRELSWRNQTQSQTCMPAT